eukprot:scaffold140025_cov27-Tisochrysis_lutea.AAC.1
MLRVLQIRTSVAPECVERPHCGEIRGFTRVRKLSQEGSAAFWAISLHMLACQMYALCVYASFCEVLHARCGAL